MKNNEIAFLKACEELYAEKGQDFTNADLVRKSKGSLSTLGPLAKDFKAFKAINSTHNKFLSTRW